MKRIGAALAMLLFAFGAFAEGPVTSGGLKRALADTLYCQLVGCTMTGAILLPNGSGAAPSGSFANFPTFGLYAETGFLDATAGESAFRVMAQTAPPGALTTALVLIAGNIDSGSHSYKVTFVTATGETEGGTTSNAVTNDGTHQQNTLTVVPTGPAGIVTQRKIYRNKVADQTHWFLQQTIADNTTATGVQDNTADANLTTAMPTTNSTIDARLTVTNAGALTLMNSTQGLTIDGAVQSAGTFAANTFELRLVQSSSGTVTNAMGPAYAGYRIGSAGSFGASSTATATGSGDTFLTRRAAANWNFGAADAASPVAQTLSFQGSRGGTDSDVAGTASSIRASLGTGLAAGSQLSISRALMGTTGTTAQSSAHAFTVCESKTLSNTSATTTTIATIGLASNSAGGMHALITLTASDGTNFDSETQDVTVSFVNKAGVITVGTPLISASTAANNSGSATIGATITGASPTISLKVTPVYGTIVPSTVTVYAEIFNHGAGAVACQ